ncbi:hypothetical protein FKW77_008956 [Venturia effusa]|uniref:CCHC-type domain-containing protein n=1 Tax=Venturia effusa TaxID=50376 RepID=A0A517LBI4_9PEZI|nr:hypothetical protein FKW77_008956 [Venturia effusa]
MRQRSIMNYLAANDDVVEDEVRAVATNISTNNPEFEEDSRTAIFSSRGTKRMSPEVVIIARDSNSMDIHEISRSSKRQKTEGAIEGLNKTSVNDSLDQPGQEQACRERGEEPTAVPTASSEHTSSASGRLRRTSKTKQQKISTANSKPKPEPIHEEVTSSTSGPALGTRSRRTSNKSIQAGGTGPSGMEDVKPSSSASRQILGTKVRITSLPSRVTLDELKVFLTGYNHDPLPPLSMNKKKRKKAESLLVTFSSISEAQKALTELNGTKLRSRTVHLEYDDRGATEPQTASEPPSTQNAAPVSQSSLKPQPSRASRVIEIVSDEEEGEISENASAQTLDLPSTGSAEELHQIELINNAARQMAARVSKGKFKLDRTQQNFRDGTALSLSVQWPTLAAARKTVPRDVLRKRLYGIIPFARYDKIRVCLQPTAPKATDAEKCIVIYTSPEAATVAEKYLNSKQFTEQNLSFTIEARRSEDIKEAATAKAAAYKVVPKGVDRESLAIGIAGSAREDIARGMYTTKRYLTFCSNPQSPLFEEKPAAKNAISKQSISSKVNNDDDASKLSSLTTKQTTTQFTSHLPNMSPSSSLTDLPIPVRSIMSQLSEHERKLQTKYNFIERDNEVVFCPLCNERGHMDETCLERACKHCGVFDDHLEASCPYNKKCEKCQERGHVEAECPAKLRRTAADGFIDCNICHKDGHEEEKCPDHFILMFKPPAAPRKVDSINVCCYVCAGPHFGDDCLDRDKMGRKRAPLTESMHVFTASFANRFLTTPLGPVKRYHHQQAASSGRPPAGSSRRGGRFPVVNGRDMNIAMDLDDTHDSLNTLPRRAPPRPGYIPPPPPDEFQPPLPPGPPPPSSSRHYQPPPPSRYDHHSYRGNDGYVQYQGNNTSYSDRPRSYNNVAPPNYPQQQQQQRRGRSRSPGRRRGGGYMGGSESYRDRDGPSYPRGNNSLRGPPPGPPGSSLGGYAVRR